MLAVARVGVQYPSRLSPFDKIKEQQKETGFGKLLGVYCFGNLSHELVMRNLKLFAAEVAPQIRGIA